VCAKRRTRTLTEEGLRMQWLDPESAGVSEAVWRAETASCHELRVARIIRETHDSVSIVLEVPEALKPALAYRAGQFLSFKVPYQGRVLVRSYSLSSSPDCDAEHKITVKRVEGGRISNWMNDEVRGGSHLMVVPPAGRFVLTRDAHRDIVLFSGGSGITPCISLIKSALATSGRWIRLVYANRDARSIIFESELEALRAAHPDRLQIVYSVDDANGFLTAADVCKSAEDHTAADFYLCGPEAFMETAEQALLDLGVERSRIHIERFVSPPDHDEARATVADGAEKAPASISIALDGETHEVPYEPGERVLAAARRAGLEPPFSCEKGYCSSCMARLKSGRVVMAVNDCLTPELLEEGWVLTCQSRCVSPNICIEYPD
jgi:3-ketosteroid 9alpha-monooxygenase subunit B